MFKFWRKRKNNQRRLRVSGNIVNVILRDDGRPMMEEIVRKDDLQEFNSMISHCGFVVICVSNTGLIRKPKLVRTTVMRKEHLNND